MKKALLIATIFLMSGICFAQNPGLAVIDTTFNHRDVVGQLNQVTFNFQDSTVQLIFTRSETVDTILMRTDCHIINKTQADVAFWPTTVQQTKYKTYVKNYLNWRKGTIKNGAK
jgi:hypothetical protein